MEHRFDTIGIVGLGLIGGSLAMTLKRRTKAVVYGFDRDEITLKKALNTGAIDGANKPLSECDILFVALYPHAAEEFVSAHIQELSPGTIVSDLCGVKRKIAASAEPICHAAGVHYIGAHPMAGRELSGFDNAKDTLFEGASVILTPKDDADPEIVQALGAFFVQAGFGRVVRTTPEHHDRMIAYTSQLAHVLSSAYIQNPLAQDYSGFTGGSFQDLTRVARLSADMWGELFFQNSDELIMQLDVLIDKLKDYRRALLQQDQDSLWSLMEQGTRIKNCLLQHSQETSQEKLEME